jgi:hypothetical protein
VKVLFLHPADDPSFGPWADERWSRLIDLGLAGSDAYARWKTRLGVVVEPMRNFRNGFEEIGRVRELLSFGSGRLLDGDGLDWWDLNSILVHEQMESLVLLKRVLETLGEQDQVYITHAGFHADALQALGCKKIVSFRPREGSRGPGHYLRVAAKFPLWQLTQIFWDKYDAGFQFRGRLAPKRKASDRSLVLLPSAYVNVSRTAIAYASAVPDLKFLLTATRQSGCMSNVPANVESALLSSYASLDSARRQGEFLELMQRWLVLRQELRGTPELAAVFDLGLMGDFAARLRQGLEIRDAWKNVFEREPVQAVLCADDTNPYTRIPLLLGRKRGLPSISCHHGALDGRYMIKQSQADLILSKGRMEQDYLVRVCGVDRNRVELGAPPHAKTSNVRDRAANEASPIVFFSEPYETVSARSTEFYRDILPPLANLATRNGRELIVKLHPAESERERGRMLSQILDPSQRKNLSVRSGALAPEFLSQIWFGITVLSTVAVECAEAGVPCFLCEWLEFWPYGYIDQFSRFGVGHRLKHPAEISSIPEILRSYRVLPRREAEVSSPIDPHRLEDLLTGRAFTAGQLQKLQRAAQ